MKKLVSIILLFVITVSLAACVKPADPVVKPTNEPTASAPSAVPTEEPTAAPTDETTPEPTAVPEPVALSFEDCAELALRLPWGEGENEVFFKSPAGEEDDMWVIPIHFNVIGGKVYVFDRYFSYGSGILSYDLESGASERLGPDTDRGDFFCGAFAVLGGKVIFADRMFDLETGEMISVQRIPDSCIMFMNVRDGKCFAYIGIGDQIDGEYCLHTPETDVYDEYEFDPENLMWILKRRIEMPQNIPHASPELDPGCDFICWDRYMGTDANGNHYVDSTEIIVLPPSAGAFRHQPWRRIVKLSPEGQPLSYVDVAYPDDFIMGDWGEEDLIFRVGADGTVWYMCATEEELLIYKINL